MRVFNDMREAISEIQRDISKSPTVTTSSTQGIRNVILPLITREAMVYAYTVKDIPDALSVLLIMGIDSGLLKEDGDIKDLLQWAHVELGNRFHWSPAKTEHLHPKLSGIVPLAPTYSYSDRLQDALQVISATLTRDLSTRRAYWPIYDRQDALNSARDIRIPCSIGYHFMIRTIGDTPHLHMTYLQRSCDFNNFWLTDVWLARQFQKKLCDTLQIPDIKIGYFTHFILSLHSFIEGEIY